MAINKLFNVGMTKGVTQIKPKKSGAVKKKSDESKVRGDGASISDTAKKASKKKSSEIKKEPPAEKPKPGDYHFKPQFKVEQQGSKWIMHLPNAKIPLPGKPEWLAMIDRMNGILDKSSDPGTVKNTVDSIKKTADKSYESSNRSIDTEKVDKILGSVKDKALVKDTKAIFSEMLKNETKSTHQVGGVLAGNNCSEMHKYGHIMKSIDQRLASM